MTLEIDCTTRTKQKSTLSVETLYRTRVRILGPTLVPSDNSIVRTVYSYSEALEPSSKCSIEVHSDGHSLTCGEACPRFQESPLMRICFRTTVAAVYWNCPNSTYRWLENVADKWTEYCPLPTEVVRTQGLSRTPKVAKTSSHDESPRTWVGPYWVSSAPHAAAVDARWSFLVECVCCWPNLSESRPIKSATDNVLFCRTRSQSISEVIADALAHSG